MLDVTPEVEPIRKLVSKRLMDSGKQVGAQKQLDQMLLTLWAAGYVQLDPEPPARAAEPGRVRETGPTADAEADRDRADARGGAAQLCTGEIGGKRHGRSRKVAG